MPGSSLALAVAVRGEELLVEALGRAIAARAHGEQRLISGVKSWPGGGAGSAAAGTGGGAGGAGLSAATTAAEPAPEPLPSAVTGSGFGGSGFGVVSLEDAEPVPPVAGSLPWHAAAKGNNRQNRDKR